MAISLINKSNQQPTGHLINGIKTFRNNWLKRPCFVASIVSWELALVSLILLISSLQVTTSHGSIIPSSNKTHSREPLVLQQDQAWGHRDKNTSGNRNPRGTFSAEFKANSTWNYFLERNKDSPSTRFYKVDGHLTMTQPKRKNRKNLKNKGGKKSRRRINKVVTQDIIEFPKMDEKPFLKSQIMSDRNMLIALDLKNFNTDFLSINQPQDSHDFPNGKLHSPRRKHHNPIIKDVRRFFQQSPSLNRGVGRLNKGKRRLIRRFVIGYTQCPIRYTWRRQSINIWPRWIKEGKCDNQNSVSCSLPPGMTCKPDQKKSLHLLRHICLKSWPTSRCGWYRMEFSVTSSCKCAC